MGPHSTWAHPEDDKVQFVAFDVETHDWLEGDNFSPYEKDFGQFCHFRWVSAKNLNYSRVVQLGWCSYNKYGQLLKRVSRFVRDVPGGVSHKAAKKHRITNDHLEKEGVALCSALFDFVQDLEALEANNGTLIAHHIEFDAGMVWAELNRVHFNETHRNRFCRLAIAGVCTMILASEVLRVPRPKLCTALRQCGICFPDVDQHDAAKDAEYAAALYFMLQAKRVGSAATRNADPVAPRIRKPEADGVVRGEASSGVPAVQVESLATAPGRDAAVVSSDTSTHQTPASHPHEPVGSAAMKDLHDFQVAAGQNGGSSASAVKVTRKEEGTETDVNQAAKAQAESAAAADRAASSGQVSTSKRIAMRKEEWRQMRGSKAATTGQEEDEEDAGRFRKRVRVGRPESECGRTSRSARAGAGAEQY